MRITSECIFNDSAIMLQSVRNLMLSYVVQPE